MSALWNRKESFVCGAGVKIGDKRWRNDGSWKMPVCTMVNRTVEEKTVPSPKCVCFFSSYFNGLTDQSIALEKHLMRSWQLTTSIVMIALHQLVINLKRKRIHRDMSEHVAYAHRFKCNSEKPIKYPYSPSVSEEWNTCVAVLNAWSWNHSLSFFFVTCFSEEVFVGGRQPRCSVHKCRIAQL